MYRSTALLACILLLLSALPGPDGYATPGPSAADAHSAAAPTTIYLVRHAERADDDPEDPSLTHAGEIRARALQAALRHVQIDAIYTTHFQRTRLTAKAVIDAQQPPVHENEVVFDHVEAHVEELAETLRTDHPGETVLVVGHSNTTPRLAEALTGHPVPELRTWQYDRLFVVTLHPDRPTNLLVARYGVSTP